MVWNSGLLRFVVAVAVFGAACGDSVPLQAPTAPSSTNSAMHSEGTDDTSVASDETTVGTVETNGTVRSLLSASPEKTLVVRGKIARLTGDCPSRTFRVGARTIVVTNRASRYRGGSCHALANGVAITVAGTLVTAGGTQVLDSNRLGSTLVAKQVEIDDDDVSDDDSDDVSDDDSDNDCARHGIVITRSTSS